MARKIAPIFIDIALVLEMIRLRLILCVVSVLAISNGVRVNMKGSLRLGKEVLDALTHYMAKNNLISMRRSYGNGEDPDTVAVIVNAAFLCRDINFCKRSTGKLLNEYIITLTNSVESIFEGLVQDKNAKEIDDVKLIIFEEELKVILQDVKKILEHIGDQEDDDPETYKWLNLLKKICAKFLSKAVTFASERLEGSPNEIKEVKKMLTQKLTITLTLVELKFEHKLCSTHKICSKSYECTKALEVLLDRIGNLPDKKVKDFLRYFHENLAQTSFSSMLSDSTKNEFQSIVNEMAYSDNIPTKNVLSTIHKTVKDRLTSVRQNIDSLGGRDVKLVHVILSDLDHFYSKQKNPFGEFMNAFFDWSEKDSRISAALNSIMNELQKQLSFEEPDLVMKLKSEVRVFLEVTVDPEK